MNAVTSEDEKKRQRRTYGRGMFDGLRMAGITNPEEFMNATKLADAERSQTSIARKVLHAVPVDEPAAISSIRGELRNRGINSDVSMVAGCLGTLKSAGLVKESKPGEFIRIMPKERPPAVELPPPVVTPKQQEPEPPGPPSETQPEPGPEPDPLDRLASIASSAKALGDQVKLLAAEIEDVALEVDRRIQKIRADIENLEKLKSFLKNLA